MAQKSSDRSFKIGIEHRQTLRRFSVSYRTELNIGDHNFGRRVLNNDSRYTDGRWLCRRVMCFGLLACGFGDARRMKVRGGNFGSTRDIVGVDHGSHRVPRNNFMAVVDHVRPWQIFQHRVDGRVALLRVFLQSLFQNSVKR